VRVNFTEGVVDFTALEGVLDCIRSTSSIPEADSGAWLDAGMTATQAFLDGQFRQQLVGHFPPNARSFAVAGSASYKLSPKGAEANGMDSGTITVGYTITYGGEADLEAIIIPPKDYAQWMPEESDEPGADEQTEGNDITVEATLQVKGHPQQTAGKKAKFKFELVGTSREPGICLNEPAFDPARLEKKAPYDLKLLPEDNSDLTVAPDGQSATTKQSGTSASITIACFDWGAYTKLKVTATTDDGDVVVAHLSGQPAKTVLTIPLDDNGNHVADAWERQMKIYEKNLPADWDEAEEPKGQKEPGDGISLYEKYRGFEFASGHEQLDPNHKYLFIHDPDDIVSTMATDPNTVATSFEAVSGLYVRYVDMDHWTGSGSSTENRRIVNYNSGTGHATDQTALDVTTSFAKDAEPPGWRDVLKQHDITTGWTPSSKRLPWEPKVATSGMSYPEPGAGLGPPKDTYAIVIYVKTIISQLGVHMLKHFVDFTEFKRRVEQDDDFERTMGRAVRLDPHNDAYKKFWALRDAADAEYQRAMKAAIDKWVDYVKAHLDACNKRQMRELAWVVAHELGHGVGVEHHKPLDGGDKACVMPIINESACGYNPDDPLDLKYYTTWPDTFCGKGGSGGPCWSQIVVSDRKGK